MDIKQVPHVVIETGGEKIKKSYEQIMERGGDCMFDCGIHEFIAEVSREVAEKHDAMVVEEVYKVGIDIDKEQLERALLDAKSFYDDGFKDGIESKCAYWEFREFDELTGITASNFCTHCGMPKGQVYDNYCGCCGYKMLNAKKGEEQ